MAANRSGRKTATESRRPPSGDTPRAAELTPPSRPTHDVLPVVDIGSVDLEKLCRDILRLEYPHVLRGELKRERGQKQFGADVEGFNAKQVPDVVVSCKCYRDTKAWHLMAWAKEFTDHLDGHWLGKGVTRFILAVSCAGNDDAINDAARVVCAHLDKFGILFDFWTVQKISDLARKDPGLVGRYFNKYWQDALSPNSDTTGAIAVAGPLRSNVAMSLAIAELTNELTATMSRRDSILSKRLDEAQTAFRSGRPSILSACLDEILNDGATWNSLDVPVQSKVLRASALIALHRDDADAALTAIDKADQISAAPDRSLRALVIRAINGAEAALAFIAVAASTREIECKASLLLELGRIQDAIDELTQAPPDRPECMRLRAIALCLQGEREGAVTLAEAARKAEPASVLGQQTAGILHVMAALSDRAEVQLGPMPNPIDPGLVKGTQKDLDHLIAAEAVFASLAALIEAPDNTEAEIWRLACLVLHPDQRANARRLANELISRPDLEPVAVAWARLGGLPIRNGYVRKVLGDALRAGKGTPSHIVVDALLAADKDGPAAAVAVLDRHSPLFPNAASFLAEWRSRFSGHADGDVLLEAINDDGIADRFTALAGKIKTGNHTGHTVLLSAEWLADNEAWVPLCSIETKLAELRTPRAVEIMANATFYADRPSDTLRILESNFDCFRNGELPPSLVDLKARAHDALGDKKRALSSLEDLVCRTNSPQARRRLVQAYIRVGNLASARYHAERYVFETTSDPRDAIVLAEVMKLHDREFSRQLILHAAAHPALPPRIAPQTFALAIEFGLKDVEARLAPIVFDIDRHGSQTGVIAINSVDAFVAHMNVRAEEIRQKFGTWLDGQQYSHAVWSNDPRTFALLYLAASADRRDSIGQRIPMLISTAGFERPLPVLTADKPVLVLDISSLLLATRCQLLDTLTGAFTIKIPDSVQHAILEMEKSLPAFSTSLLAAGRELHSATYLTLIDAECSAPKAIPLSDPEDASAPNGPLLLNVLTQAVNNGKLARHTAEIVAERFSLVLADAPLSPLPDGLVISRGLALQLTEASVLKAVCRTLPTFWTSTERSALIADVAQGERMMAYRALLSGLRGNVADKLQHNIWTVLPKRTDPKWNQSRASWNPHVLCLAEVVSALEANIPGLYWIEDRFVQQSADSRLVGIVDVLQLLVTRDALTSAVCEQTLTELRRAGYGFLQPDIQHMVADILAAPIHGDNLCETSELSEWRAWFAVAVDQLRYCHKLPRHDAEGGLVGESRHTLDVMAVARNVLWAIWQTPDQTDEQKIIRSNWVWLCLRVEQMDFFPVVAAAGNGATTLVAVSLAHMADVPLMSLVCGKDVAKGSAKTFLPWLFHAIIDPRCAVDETFAAQVLAHLSRTVALVLSWMDGNDPEVEPEKIRLHIRLRVYQYLDLLPDAWRQQLLDDTDLSKRMAGVTTLIATLDDFEFEAALLAEQLASAIGSLGEQAEVRRNVADRHGKPFILRVRPSAKLAPTVSLEADRKNLTLDPTLVALHMSDRTLRCKALIEAASDLDGPVHKRDDELLKIADIEIIEDRIETLRAFQARDFSATCSRVRSAVRLARPIDSADVTLPDPHVLRSYLRMGETDGTDAVSLASTLFMRLQAELGSQKAAARLSGCPFQFSSDVIAAIGLAAQEAAAPGQSKILHTDAALETLTLLRGLAHAAPGERAIAEELVNRLIDQVGQQTSLILALLASAARHAERAPSWIELPRELAAFLIWIWAERITSALVTGGADPKGAATLIEESRVGGLVFILDAGRAPGWWRETVRSVDEGRFAAAVLGQAVGILAARHVSVETQRRLLATAGHFLGEAWMPRLDATFPPEEGPIGYWPSQDVVTIVAASGMASILAPFDVREPTDYVRALIAETVAGVDVPGRLAILSFIDVSKLDADDARQLREHIQTLIAQNELSAAAPGYRRGLALIAATFAMCASAVECNDFIVKLAGSQSAQWPEVELAYSVFEESLEPSQAFSMLVEMMLAFAHHTNEPFDDKVRWIGSTTEDIVQAWPNSVRGAIAFLDRSIARLEIKSAAFLWPALNRLRSIELPGLSRS